MLRPSHLKLVAEILNDRQASENDRLVAMEMLKNAEIAVEGEFPLCQDTGTAKGRVKSLILTNAQGSLPT